MIYNEPYNELLGNIHPCMGVSARVALKNIWEEFFEPLVARNLLGEAVEKTDYHVSVTRNGYLEETYFSLKFMPIFDYTGVVIGHYQPLDETVRYARCGKIRGRLSPIT